MTGDASTDISTNSMPFTQPFTCKFIFQFKVCCGGTYQARDEIVDMQCGFMSKRGSTNAIFILRQLQEKHLASNKPLYMVFVDLEKAFDRVPQDVIWWAMRELGIDE